MTRTLLAGAIAAVTLLTAVRPVSAGLKSYMPLSVNYASRYANGGLSETHNTADNVQYAECGSNPTTGYCTVRDTAGTYSSCYTTDAAIISVIRSMSDESLFSIQWNASGVCTYVLSYASSRAEAKAH